MDIKERKGVEVSVNRNPTGELGVVLEVDKEDTDYVRLFFPINAADQIADAMKGAVEMIRSGAAERILAPEPKN